MKRPSAQVSQSIRRLQKALLEPQLEEDMNIEDEVLNEFHKKDEQIAVAMQLAEEAMQREEKARQREEEARQREEGARQRAEAERTAKNALIRQLAAMGMPTAQIAAMTGMNEAAVQEVLDET